MGLQYLSEEASAPTSPASGQVVLYPKTDHFLYWKDSTGTVRTVIQTTGTLTSGRVPYVTTGGVLTDDANATYDGTTFALGVNKFTVTAASGATTIGGAITYGGVTLSNAVTGTGNMVLSASPTFTGTLTAATINASGVIGGGGVTGAFNVFAVSGSAEAGTLLGARSGNAGDGFLVYDVRAGGQSLTATAASIGKNSSTSRSINAGGTLNASGADYAEYETKRDDCGVIVKGQVVGFDANGLLTDRWSLAVSFGIKSTNPNLVGGDSWASEETLGMVKPREPVLVLPPKPEECLQITQSYSADMNRYLQDKSAFDAKVEAARQKVDRIAYSGKCPVNVYGAKSGQWIVAAKDGEAIKGIASDSWTPDALGRVRCVLPDGRAEIKIL